MPLLCGLPQPPAVLSAAARCQQSGVWVKIRLVEGLGKIRASMTVHCQVDVVINLPVHHSLLPLSLGLRHLYWPLFRRHRTPRYKLFCERFHHHSPFFRASTSIPIDACQTNENEKNVPKKPFAWLHANNPGFPNRSVSETKRPVFDRKHTNRPLEGRLTEQHILTPAARHSDAA